ncbi:MAG: 5'-nucleotidase C-terminal domain-containing protein [Candidatus Riflebacteria bacterium]|nr:5'-nucleotidase C-terminal domain-containing protein [Candidatus Riflebacteria bacterium]
MLRILSWIAGILIVLLAILTFNDRMGLPTKFLYVFYTSNLRGQIKPFTGELGDYSRLNAGGLAFIKGFIKSFMDSKEVSSNSILLLDTGDSLFGSAECSLTMGKAMFDLMEKMPYDAMAVGNMEFELGLNVLRSFSEKNTLPLLACNYRDLKVPLGNTFAPGKLFEKSGSRIGVIGLGHGELFKQTKRDNLLDIEITDMKAAVARTASYFKSQGAELVILLSHHPNLDNREKVKDLFPDVDVVIGDLIAPKSKSETENANLLPLVCPSPYSRGGGIGILKVPYQGGSWKVEHASVQTRIIDTEAITPDSDMIQEVSKIESKVDTLLEEIVAYAEGDFKRAYNAESPIGNLIADACRETAKSNIALQNSGGIKASISSGPISLRDLYDLLPFENNIVKINLRGWEIENLMEESLGDANSFLQASGINCTYSSHNPPGFRIIQLAINQEPIEWNNVYSVAMTDYMYENRFWASLANHEEVQIIGPIRESLKNCLINRKRIGVSTERRFEDIGEQDEVLAKQSLEIEIASLSQPLSLTLALDSPMACYIAEILRQETDSDIAFINHDNLRVASEPIGKITPSVVLEIFGEQTGLDIVEISGKEINGILSSALATGGAMISFAGFSIELLDGKSHKIFPWEGDFDPNKIYKVAIPANFPNQIQGYFDLTNLKRKRVFSDLRRVFLTGVRRKNGKVESRRAIY